MDCSLSRCWPSKYTHAHMIKKTKNRQILSFYPVIDHIKEGARCLNATDWTNFLRVWKEKKRSQSVVHSLLSEFRDVFSRQEKFYLIQMKMKITSQSDTFRCYRDCFHLT